MLPLSISFGPSRPPSAMASLRAAPAPAPLLIYLGDALHFDRSSSSLSFSCSLPPARLSTKLRRLASPPPRATISSNGSPLRNDLAREFVKRDREKGLRGSEAAVLDRLRSALALLRSILPGGSWWNLEVVGGGEGAAEEGRGDERKKGLPVMVALRQIWVLVKNDRLVIFVGFASLLIAVLSEMAIPHFLTASIFAAQSRERMVFYRNLRFLILLTFTSGICSGLRSCCFGIANMTLVRRVREMLYTTLLFQDASFYDKETVGDLTSRLGSDCQQVSRIIGNDLNLISRNILQATGALICLLILSWRLALSTFLICSALWSVMLFHGQYQKKAAKLVQECTAGANEVAQETLSLFRTVRIYGTEKQEYGRYVSWLEKLFNVNLRQSVAYGYWSSGFSFLNHSTQVIAVLMGGISVLSGHFTAETLTKFILYSEWLIYSSWFLGDNWSSLMQSIGASEKVFGLMDLLPSNQFVSEGLKLEKLIGHVEFVNVSFFYPSRTMVPVLQKINLSIHPNEVVAIVGLSGSGKSTLVNLLLRLYEPTSGQILVDGFPLGDLDIRWLRHRIGYVGQEPRLFRMDVSSNIKYGCPMEVSNEAVEWAAKQAYAHDFISSLPNGYETLVDDSLLSGGQKQRIAIARAILRDPTILILDEATSALDAESEHYIKGVIHAFRSSSGTRRSVIIIAHRLSTIQAADKIIVMESGRIVETGNHAELLQMEDGLYARLVKRQVDAFAD